MIEIPIVRLFDQLEKYYFERIEYLDRSDYRDNVKINELENVEQMAMFYRLPSVELTARKAIERILDKQLGK